MRWPIARNRVSTPTSSTESVSAAGAEVRLLPVTRLEAFSDAVVIFGLNLLPVIAVIFYLAVSIGDERLPSRPPPEARW